MTISFGGFLVLGQFLVVAAPSAPPLSGAWGALPVIRSQPLLTDTVQLDSGDGSDVSGTAVVTRTTLGAQVVLHLSGLRAGAQYPAEIRAGSCMSGGSLLVELNPVGGRTDGRGQSSTLLPSSELQDGQRYFVLAYTPQIRKAACGDFPLVSAQR